MEEEAVGESAEAMSTDESSFSKPEGKVKKSVTFADIEENLIPYGPKKKPRQRIKGLLKSLTTQLQFYFSDSNLSKDRFMKKYVEENPEGYVPLETIMSFNKMKELTTDSHVVKLAIKNSNMLALSADGTKVRRSTPIKYLTEEEVEERTIYVDGLQKYATHDWLKEQFSYYGSVSYVSIPRYKTTKGIKGFAFIEFEKAEEAAKVVEEWQRQVPWGEKEREVLEAEVKSLLNYNNHYQKMMEKQGLDGEKIDITPQGLEALKKKKKKNRNKKARRKIRKKQEDAQKKVADGDEQEGGTAQPQGGEAVQPLQGEATQPLKGEATQPQEREATQPQVGEAVQPLEMEATQFQEGEATQPLEGEATQPQEEEATQQSGETTQEGASGSGGEQAQRKKKKKKKKRATKGEDGSTTVQTEREGTSSDQVEHQQQQEQELQQQPGSSQGSERNRKRQHPRMHTDGAKVPRLNPLADEFEEAYAQAETPPAAVFFSQRKVKSPVSEFDALWEEEQKNPTVSAFPDSTYPSPAPSSPKYTPASPRSMPSSPSYTPAPHQYVLLPKFRPASPQYEPSSTKYTPPYNLATSKYTPASLEYNSATPKYVPPSPMYHSATYRSASPSPNWVPTVYSPVSYEPAEPVYFPLAGTSESLRASFEPDGRPPTAPGLSKKEKKKEKRKRKRESLEAAHQQAHTDAKKMRSESSQQSSDPSADAPPDAGKNTACKKPKTSGESGAKTKAKKSRLSTDSKKEGGSGDEICGCGLKKKRKVKAKKVVEPKEDTEDKDGKRRRKRKRVEKMPVKLRVFSKKEWVKLKELYLRFQKERMKMLKESLKKPCKKVTEEGKENVVEVESTLGNKHPQPEFEANAIVQVTSDYSMCVQTLKAEIPPSVEVRYVDVKSCKGKGYIRCANAEHAAQLIRHGVTGYNLSLVEGEDELAYWEKLKNERLDRLARKERPKRRGKAKLLQRAQRPFEEKFQGKHLKFNDLMDEEAHPQ